MSFALSLLIYAALVILLILFSLLVVFNFVRYRFQGDKTLLFIGLFYVAFVITIITTILLTRSITPDTIQPAFPDFF